MPVIARFDGITIRMFYNDHPPPHFHVQHGDQEAIMAISGGALLAGALPLAVLRRVSAWAAGNRSALDLAWQRARAGEGMGEI